MRSRSAKLTYRPTVERLEDRRLLAAGPMTAVEQHLHEILNWVRANPSAASQLYNVPLNQGLTPGTISTDPKPPLARNGLLRDAMDGHLRYLQQNNLFGHTGSGGSTYVERIEAAGYLLWTSVAENLVWTGSTGPLGDLFPVAEQLVADWFDSPLHRENVFRANLVEVGTNLIEGPFTYQGTTYNAALAGQDFGSQAKDNFITGVGCTTRHSSFDICDVTTAISGATVSATRQSDQLQMQVQTGATGEYDLQVPGGTWDVVITGGGLPGPVQFSGIVMASTNVKLDFMPVSAHPWQNLANPLDVNNDTYVVPADALVIINSLNLDGARPLPVPPVFPNVPPPFYDAKGDDYISPVDALIVINFLNGHGEGEGEFVPPATSGILAHPNNLQDNSQSLPAPSALADDALMVTAIEDEAITLRDSYPGNTQSGPETVTEWQESLHALFALYDVDLLISHI